MSQGRKLRRRANPSTGAQLQQATQVLQASLSALQAGPQAADLIRELKTHVERVSSLAQTFSENYEALVDRLDKLERRVGKLDGSKDTSTAELEAARETTSGTTETVSSNSK